MKCIITGHTQGIGKILFEHFTNKGWNVVGASRSNGYTFPQDLDKFIELASGCDLFINNSQYNQLDLLNALHEKVNKIIVMGSIAGDYDPIIRSEYSKNKKDLAIRCKEISLLPKSTVLHLKISMLEDAVSSDKLIPYSEVVDFIDYWLAHPVLSSVDFDFKLTPFTLGKIKEKFGATQESIDYILSNMCNEKRQNF